MFDISQTEFPSNPHRIAWYLGVCILPFSAVIPDDPDNVAAEALSVGEKSLHSFLGAVYADMYEHPKTYRMTEIEDLTFNDGEWYKQRPDMTKAMKRNAHMLKLIDVLYEIGNRSALRGETLVLKRAVYEEIFTSIIPKSVSRPKLKACIEALGTHGFEISGSDTLDIRSTRYPKMLVALKAMCRHRDDDNRKRVFALQRCDFAAVNEPYEPDIRQILSTLPEGSREHAVRITDHMSGAGYKVEFTMGGYPSSIWTVAFSGSKSKKASSFFSLGFSIEYRNMFYASLHCMNPQHLIPIVKSRDARSVEWFSSMWRQECNGCGYCRGKFKHPGPYILEVNGKKRGLCHQNWITKRNPDNDTVHDLLEMVDLHTAAGLITRTG